MFELNLCTNAKKYSTLFVFTSLLVTACSGFNLEIIDISAGASHTIILTVDGEVWAWGTNSMGQLGDGTTQRRARPVKIMEDVISIDVGHGHALAITSDGTLWVWGRTGLDQYGIGLTYIFMKNPVRVTGDVVYISAGGGHSTFITTDGIL